MNTCQRKKRAFTLVEVLVVVVIIGILFLVVMSRVDFTTDVARESGVDTVLKSYQLAANAVGLDRAGFTEDLSELVAQLNKRLDSELQLSVSGNTIVSNNTDPWGTEFRIEHYKPYKSNGELRFTSAGPDETFDTADDIILVSRYDTSTGRGEMVNEYPVNDPYHTHKFTQQIQDPAYLCEEANCVSPTLYFNVCECGVIGTTYFSVGSPNYSNHGNKTFSYSPLNDEQHLINTSCSRCKLQITAEPANHVVDEELGLCVVCGEVYNHTHNYVLTIPSDEFLVSPADCVKSAVYYKSCVCGAMSTETFEDNAPLGHTIVNGGTSAVHLYCEKCNTTISSTHVFDVTNIYEATCSSMGASRYQCSCGYTYIENIDLKPHTYGEAATCTTAQYCTVCNTVVADKLGHSYTNIGIEHMHSQCIRCGEAISQHVFSMSILQEATCISKGKTEYACECGYSYNREDINMNPSNHSSEIVMVGTKDVHSKYGCCNLLVSANHQYDKIVISEPTCDATGTTKYMCACGYAYNVTEDIIDHVFGAPATCTTAQTCVFCGDVKNPALGHDSEPTGGLINAHDVCTRCSAILSDNHTYSLQSKTSSTCQKHGSETWACDCGAKYTNELPLTGHTPPDNITNCQEDTTCTVCGIVLAGGTAHDLDQTNVSENVHGVCKICKQEIEHPTTSIVRKSIASATCTTYEIMLETCECGYSKQYNNINSGFNPNIHSGSIAFVGEEKKHQEYSCCGVLYSDVHNFKSAITQQATCIAEGIRTYSCECGYSYTVSLALNASNHADNCQIVAGNEKTIHSKWSQCNRVASSTHIYTGVSMVPSTCITLGKTTYTCSCGYSYVQNLTTYDPSVHEKGTMYGGKSVSHIEYECCHLVTSANHTYSTIVYNTSCGGMATGTCICGYSLSEVPTVKLYSRTDATCISPRKEVHEQTFPTFGKRLCNEHSVGELNPYNHPNGGIIEYGGTKQSCEQYACCKVVTDSVHTYGAPSYTYQNNGAKAIGTATCYCSYTCEQVVAGKNQSLIAEATCSTSKKISYDYAFSSPFSEFNKVHDIGSPAPHNYKYDDYWETIADSALGGGNHKWVRVTAVCTMCSISYTEQVENIQIPNGWFDGLQDPCSNSTRTEWFAYTWMFTKTDNKGNAIFTKNWRCYTDADGICNSNSHRLSYIPGHSIIDVSSNWEPIGPVAQTWDCNYGTMAFSCAVCKEYVYYYGTKLSSSDSGYATAYRYFMNNYRVGNQDFCVFYLKLKDKNVSFFSYDNSMPLMSKYRLYYDRSAGKMYMACGGHAGR